MPGFDFTTGPATLPDVGELSYNGCIFSPLFQTNVSCVFIKDEAGRTTKEIEYTIEVDGYVTLPDGAAIIEGVMATLERLLSAQAGLLRYTGRGIRIVVNGVGGDQDVAWGPHPEILDIVPLGSGRSAHIKWTVKTRIPPRVSTTSAFRLGPVLQFSYGTTVSYDEEGYSELNLSGIVEIPLTRSAVADRQIVRTADDFRRLFPGQLLQTIDLTRFQITSREFKVSKDKRTLTFNVSAKELSWMAMPPDVTIARGQFTFKPAKAGVGLCNWLCSLTCTYSVAKGRPRRIAWLAFLALLRIRMQQGNLHGSIPPPAGNQNPGVLAVTIGLAAPPIAIGSAISAWRQNTQTTPTDRTRRVWLLDFNGTEGLYIDARTVTFSATWRLVTTFSTILVASGLWKKVPAQTENAWATSVRSISGDTSWLANRTDPNADVIVDFGY